MGLDVTAFRDIRKLDALFDDDGKWINPVTREPIQEDCFHARVNPEFPSQAAGIEHNAIYAYAAAVRGWSGAYSRYSRWREQLAKLAGYPAARGPYWGDLRHTYGAFETGRGPFCELIWFSDSEGIIGPDVAAKLARDFAEWDGRAKALGDEEFYSRYAQWRLVFETAADNGAVDFH